MTHRIRITIFFLAIFLGLSFSASASEVTNLNTFSDGLPAKAKDVNDNFQAVKNAVDDNHQKILTLSETRSASVTYSAMGFTPGKGEATKVAIILNNFVVENYATEFIKDAAVGSLAILNGDSGAFYHSVSLRSGVTITRIRARVKGAVTVRLKKEGDADPLAEETATGDTDQIIEVAGIDHQVEEFPAAYFIEVLLGNTAQRLYSVAVDYTYTEP